MKRILLLFCFILMGHGILHAQEANRSLKEIITSIENETGYSFVYSENIDLSQRKEVVVNEKTLKNILSAVFKGTGIAYKIDGKHIVLLREPEKNYTAVPGICEGPPLPEVVIEENKSLTYSLADIELSDFDIRKIPSPGGEPDVIKSLQLLPGIQAGMGVTSDLYVRGGDVDQNLVLLDGVNVYNLNHFNGFFSIFNGDAIRKVSLYKSEFPARFGERLSSVIDIRSKSGDMQRYHGSLSLGLISSHFNLEGPIVKDKTSFNISARRSYFDLISWVVAGFKNDKSEKAYFYDINAGITHKFSDKSRLDFNFYHGKDKISGYSMGMGYYDISNKDADAHWGNTIASLHWYYKLSSKLSSRFSIAYSNYSFESNLQSSIYSDYNVPFYPNPYFFSEIRQQQSGIQDWSFKTDWEFLPNNKHHIRFGSGFIFHTFSPTTMLRDQDDIFYLLIDKASGVESFLYAEDEMTLSKQWKANLGLRFSTFNDRKKTWASLQPRISLQYEANQNLLFRASYATMNQYIHLLTPSISNGPADLWMPAIAPGLPPMQSQQFTLGGFYDTKEGYDFSIEGFYKRMNDLSGHNFSGSFTPWNEQIELGKGRSYGIELFARKTTGKLTGGIAYTLAWNDRQFLTINNGNWFPASYDRRHDLKINATYKLNRKIDFSAAWTLSSGPVYTLPVEGYYLVPGHLVDIYEERNNFRLPPVHRLDLSVNYYRKKNAKGRQGIWNFTLYNVYGTFEPFDIYLYGEPRYINRRSYFKYPVPSISYTYKF